MDAGALIRDARLRQGWSQARLAHELQVRPSTVGRWESGSSAITTVRLDEILLTIGYQSRVILEHAEADLSRRIDELRHASYAERLGRRFSLDPLYWRRAGLVISGSVAARLQGIPVETDEVLALVPPGWLRGWFDHLGQVAHLTAAPHADNELVLETRSGRLLRLREVDPMPPTMEIFTANDTFRIVELSALTADDVDPDLVRRVLQHQSRAGGTTLDR